MKHTQTLTLSQQNLLHAIVNGRFHLCPVAERSVFREMIGDYQIPINHGLIKGVNIVKFAMAIVVVAIHTTDWRMMGLVDVAVPYFFCASGFFLFKKLEGSGWGGHFWKWFKKTALLYLLWTLVYLPYAIYGLWRDALPLGKAIAVYLRNLFFVGENYLSWPLWYLIAMLYSGLAIWMMKKLRLASWMMLLLAGSLFITAKLLDIDTIPVLVKVFKTPSHLTTGLLFMTTGCFVFNRYQHRRVPHWMISGAIAVVFIAALRYSDWFIFPATAALFLSSLCSPMERTSSSLAYCTGSLSRTVYFVHMLFAGALTISGICWEQTRVFAFTILLSLVTALLVWAAPIIRTHHHKQ